jgi:LEA14-like dessication related protein
MKKKRHIVLIIFLSLFVCFGIFFLVRYIGFLNNKDPYKTFILPRLDETIVDITSLTREKTELNARMLLNNPLPFKITADSIAYEFFIGDSLVLKSSYRETITLKAGDTSWIFIPVTVYNQKLVSILNRSEKAGHDSVYYEVKASFYSHLLNDKKFDVHFGRLLPLIYIPEITITHIEIDSANFNRLKLLVHSTIQNKNVFPLDTKDVSFRFAVSGNPWVKGTRPGLLPIPKDSTVEIIFPVSVSLEEVGETVFALLKKGKHIGYTFEMNMKIVAEKNILKNSLVTINSSGTIEQIIDLAKSPKKQNKQHHK